MIKNKYSAQILVKFKLFFVNNYSFGWIGIESAWIQSYLYLLSVRTARFFSTK